MKTLLEQSTNKTKNTTKVASKPRKRFFFLGVLFTLLLFCFTSLILCYMGYKSLQTGIYIPELNIANIKIKEFYIKLDEKINLDIKELYLDKFLAKMQDKSNKKSKAIESSLSLDSISDISKQVFRALSYFKTFRVHYIKIDQDNQMRIIYADEKFLVTNKDMHIEFLIHHIDENILIDILNLNVKDFKTNVAGTLNYHTKKKILSFDISLSDGTQTASISIHGDTNFKKLNIRQANSSHLKNLDFLKPILLPLKNKELNLWLFTNIGFDDAIIESFQAEIMLNSKAITSLRQSMNAKAQIKNARVYVDKELQVSPLQIAQTNLLLKGDTLSILPQAVIYGKNNIKSSRIDIALPIEHPTTLDLKLKGENLSIDDKLKNLLSIFDINLPIEIESSDLGAEFAIHIDVKDDNPDVKVNGSINGKNANVVIGENSFSASTIETKVDINPKVQRVLVNTKSITYQDILDMKELDINIDLLKKDIIANIFINYADLNLDFFTSKEIPFYLDLQRAKNDLTRNIIQAILDENSSELPNIFEWNPKKDPKIKPLKITLKGSINDNETIMEIPEFNLKFNSQKDFTDVRSDSIDLLRKYSPILTHFGISKGEASIHINTKDEDNSINLALKLNDLQYPIYSQGKQISSIELIGLVEKDNMRIYTKNKDIVLIKQKNAIKIKADNLSFNFDEAKKSSIPLLQDLFKENERITYTKEQLKKQDEFIKAKRAYEEKYKISPHTFYIEANRVSVRYGKYIIPADIITLRLQDGRTYINGSYGNGSLDAKIINGIAHIELDNFATSYIDKITKQRIFSDGLFSMRAVLNKGMLEGSINVRNTIFRDFRLLQNIVALIDTIPSLIVFKNPGLTKEGYEVRDGQISFILNDTYLGLENINLIGTAIDINGNGIINLENEDIDLSLEVSTLKSASNILSKIPIAGYLLLGENGKISTNIIVSGKLENPDVKNSMLKDAVLAPLRIFQRAFKLLDNNINSQD